MGIPRRRITRSTGVTLEVAVLDYLRELAEKELIQRTASTPLLRAAS